MARIPVDQIALLRAMHASPCLFADVQLPGGRRRYSTAMRRLTVGGYQWEAITDPILGRLVGVGPITEPRFGQAANVDLIVGGVGEDWLGDGVQGAQCDLYWCIHDPETDAPLAGLTRLMRGRLSSPREFASALVTRAIHISVEPRMAALNFGETSTRWTNAAHMRLWPGDRIFEYLGAEFTETYKS
jgi:hypothetical protein